MTVEVHRWISGKPVRSESEAVDLKESACDLVANLPEILLIGHNKMYIQSRYDILFT